MLLRLVKDVAIKLFFQIKVNYGEKNCKMPDTGASGHLSDNNSLLDPVLASRCRPGRHWLSSVIQNLRRHMASLVT